MDPTNELEMDAENWKNVSVDQKIQFAALLKIYKLIFVNKFVDQDWVFDPMNKLYVCFGDTKKQKQTNKL